MTEPIMGYRELGADEVALINEVKAMGTTLQALADKVRNTPGTDPRWAAIGVTHLQEGLMALTRSVARPTTF